MEAFPIDQVAKLDSNTVARPIVVPTARLRLHGDEPIRAEVEDRAASDLFATCAFAARSSMAVDRDAMLQNVFGNTGTLAHGPFPMTAPYADSTLHASAVRHDRREGAARFVRLARRRGRHAREERPAASIHADRRRLEPSRRRYAVLLQEQFRKIGAQVDLEQLDGKAILRTRADRGDFDAMLEASQPDPSPCGIEADLGDVGHRAELDRTCCATRIRRSMRCSTARRRRSIRRRCKSIRVARLSADHRRRAGDLLYDIVIVDAVQPPHQRRADCARTNGGRTSPTGRSRRTSGSIATASDSRTPKP